MKISSNKLGFSTVQVLVVVFVVAVVGVCGWAVASRSSDTPSSDSSINPAPSNNGTSEESNTSSKSVLQRNAETTRRKSDVARILSATNEYISNNYGSLPGALVVDGDKLVICETENDCNASTSASTGLDIYEPKNVSLKSYDSQLSVVDGSTLYLVLSADCNEDGTNVIAGSTRGIAVLYAAEKSNGFTQQCVSI